MESPGTLIPVGSLVMPPGKVVRLPGVKPRVPALRSARSGARSEGSASALPPSPGPGLVRQMSETAMKRAIRNHPELWDNFPRLTALTALMADTAAGGKATARVCRLAASTVVAGALKQRKG